MLKPTGRVRSKRDAARHEQAEQVRAQKAAEDAAIATVARFETEQREIAQFAATAVGKLIFDRLSALERASSNPAA